MTETTYLRAVGRVTAPPPPGSADERLLLRIGGCADVAFAAVELLQRRVDAAATRRIVPLAEVWGARSRSGTPGDELRVLLDRCTRPRAPLAGLSLDRPRIMGIVNVTPDSFSDGGSFATTGAAIDHARRMEDEGADIVDIGGESTRPGSDPVPVDDELRRVLPVLEGLAGRIKARISIDTRKAEVMRRAVSSGAEIINDVSALTYDPAAIEVVAESGLPVVLMHSRGDPKTMQIEPRYADVLLDVHDMLAERIVACERAGIARDRIVVDPGIGFGKTLAHNLELLAGLSIFHGLGVPVLLGVSRKRMIGVLTGAEQPAERVMGSVAATLSGLLQGANIVRVHDVKETRQAVAVWQATMCGAAPSEARA